MIKHNLSLYVYFELFTLGFVFTPVSPLCVKDNGYIILFPLVVFCVISKICDFAKLYSVNCYITVYILSVVSFKKKIIHYISIQTNIKQKGG